MKILPVLSILIFSVFANADTITPPHLPHPLPKTVDALTFFVPSGSAVGWIIGGYQTQPLPSPWGTKDPDGTKFKTYAMAEFNDPRYYEIYKADAKMIYIRYLANPDFILGFDTNGNQKGELWVARSVPTSGSKIIRTHLSTHLFRRTKNKWNLTESHPALTDISEYKVFPASDPKDPVGVRSFLKSCNCGLDSLDLLTHFDYWHNLGLIAEMYTYGYGVGFVAWRWTENLTVNHGSAVHKNPDGSGTYTCYLQQEKVTIKNWNAVIASSNKSVAPEAYVSLNSTNDTRVFTTKLNNPNISQSDWYVSCHDTTWNSLSAQKGTIIPDLTESGAFPAPKGLFGLPFEYPSHLRTASTFYQNDGKPHKILWDPAVLVTTPKKGTKYVQNYKVVIKQGATTKGIFNVSSGNAFFTVPANYLSGKYTALVSAEEGNRQNVIARLPFTIN
jgi:hypothetical protein